MNNMYKNTQGFTLTEILVVVLLFSGIVITVSTMFSFIRRTFTKVDSASSSTSEIERFILRLDQEVKTTTNMSHPPINRQSNMLRFYSNENEEILYEFSDKQLVKTNFAKNSKRTVIRGIDNLIFSRYMRNLLQIKVITKEAPIITAISLWNL